jgi:alkylated DNA nucleotide flippase Atl1
MMRFDLNHGGLAEDKVQAAIEDAFTPDFVFRSPRKIGRNQLTDVLVLFDDVGLVIESKSRSPNSNAQDNSHSSQRWAADKLIEANAQIKSAIKAMRENLVPYVENTLRGRIKFDSNKYKWLYGLIILHHVSEPYNPLELVPLLKHVEYAIHVLSFNDFMNLCHFLDTPADLINYFEHRTDVLIPTLKPRIHQEIELFGYYLHKLEEIYLLRAKSKGLTFEHGDFKPYADKLKRVIDGTYPNIKAGYVIDHILEKLHHQDPEVATLNPKGKLNDYADIAAVLGSMPRVRRINIGAVYLRIAKMAADHGASYHKVIYNRRRSECILVMASTLSRERRKERAKMLIYFTEKAKSDYKANQAIGIATEPAGQMGSSYDIVLLTSCLS